jgi:hypothetical protein
MLRYAAYYTMGVKSTTNITKLNELKTKIVKLRRMDMQKQLLDIADVDRIPGEELL